MNFDLKIESKKKRFLKLSFETIPKHAETQSEKLYIAKKKGEKSIASL